MDENVLIRIAQIIDPFAWRAGYTVGTTNIYQRRALDKARQIESIWIDAINDAMETDDTAPSGTGSTAEADIPIEIDQEST